MVTIIISWFSPGFCRPHSNIFVGSLLIATFTRNPTHRPQGPKVLYRWTGKKLAQCLWSSETRSSNYGGKREAMRTQETRRHSAQPPYVAINQWICMAKKKHQKPMISMIKEGTTFRTVSETARVRVPIRSSIAGP